MKKLILFYFLITSINIFSQELKYEEVVKVDSTLTKEEIFNRARHWIGKSFNDEKYVISTEDRTSGEISGNGVLNYSPSKMYYGARFTKGIVSFKINIFIKDGRYKYVVDSFRHEGSRIGQSWDISYGQLTTSDKAPNPNHGEPYDKAWMDIKIQTNDKVLKMIESLKFSMNKRYEGNNNW